jgi:hypothetical protein
MVSTSTENSHLDLLSVLCQEDNEPGAVRENRNSPPVELLLRWELGDPANHLGQQADAAHMDPPAAPMDTAKDIELVTVQLDDA